MSYTPGDPWAHHPRMARVVCNQHGCGATAVDDGGAGRLDEWIPPGWTRVNGRYMCPEHVCDGCGETSSRCWCREDDEPAATADLEGRLAAALADSDVHGEPLGGGLA